jgi:hypothetical protein
LGSRIPRESLTATSSRNSASAFFAFSFSLAKLGVGSFLLRPLQLLENHAVWLEDLLDSSNNFYFSVY